MKDNIPLTWQLRHFCLHCVCYGLKIYVFISKMNWQISAFASCLRMRYGYHYELCCSYVYFTRHHENVKKGRFFSLQLIKARMVMVLIPYLRSAL